MKIDYLWHSEFLVELKNEYWNYTRVLCDAWLSDYAVWDLMWRNPTFTLDYDKIWTIDAIYLSHSHTDHIDPYTLIDLYSNLKTSPSLLIPETLSFIVPLFEKHLNNPDIIILKNKQEIKFKWIFIQWYVFETPHINNEDDVMWLFLYNHEEIIFNEVDLTPPDSDEVHNYLYKVYSRQDFKSRVYIATRNELDWNLKILDIKDKNKRKSFASEYKQKRTDEIEYDYYKFTEQYVEYKDIYSLDNFHKIFIWQWITYPKNISIEPLKLQIMSLQEEVEIENKFSRNYWKSTHVWYLKAWVSYDINHKKFNELWKINYLQNFDFCEIKRDLNIELDRKYFEWPINNQERNIINQEEIILNLINNRFFPFWFAVKQDCIKNRILKNPNRSYNILVKFWTKENHIKKIYHYNFSQFNFILKDYNNEEYDENYWANDLEDYFNWTQELYSNFHHKLEKWKWYRLWTTLWMNYINNDLLYKKFDFHFKQALEWKTSSDFVLPVYKILENQ